MKNALIVLLSLALAASLLWPRTKGTVTMPPQPTAPIASAEPTLIIAPPPVVVPTPAPPPVPGRFDAIKQALKEARLTPGLVGAALGFCLIDSKGEIAIDDQAQTALIPASTLKTVTTATALQLLGPEFTFTTELRAMAQPKNGVLEGDLIVVGGGDPLLSLEHVLAWGELLKKQGITTIKGRIVGDGRFFAGSLYDDFWNWGDIGNGYGSAVCGLNLEHNRFTIAFKPGSTEGSPASILGHTPEVPQVSWQNEVLTGPEASGDGVVIYGGERTGKITLRGTVPLHATEPTAVGAVPDPETFAAFHIKAALIAAGLKIEGAAISWRQLTTLPQSWPQLLHTHHSPSLLQLITSIHATSDNHETECLYKMLAHKQQKPADQVIREHWATRGLTFVGLRMEDGCGLARADHIRPLDLAQLQFHAGKGPQGLLYKQSLLSDGPVRWKGGAMSSIRSYTGYLSSQSGEEFAFALMLNHYADGQAVAQLRQSLIKMMAEL